MRILIVEDDLELLRLYTRTLRRVNHQVYPAATIHAAGRLLSRWYFEVCIFDVQIGHHTSFDLLAQFPRLQQLGSRIIVISGQSRHREACEALGVAFYLKPVMPAQLLELVDGVSV